ncbi:MAG TPA: patatin-like phospholipase family protein [Gemmatimonadaceae bacterium]
MSVRRVSRSRRPASGRGRIGLALAGGGPAGAVYEIGALWALAESLDGLDLEALSCYVGVSAGSLLAACLANGMSPAMLVRILDGSASNEEQFEPELFFVPNYREFLRRGAALPALFGEALWHFTRRRRGHAVATWLSRAAKTVPIGLFDNEPIREYLTRVFAKRGRTDDFRRLPTKLVVVATDLDTGQIVRFGAKGNDQVPISRAVQASTALPGLYPPVMINGRDCVDGVLLKTLHASIALEEEVELLLCINPIVPVDTTVGERSGSLPPNALRTQGLPAVMSQMFRTLVHSRLELGMSTYVTRYPDADVLLFEPGRDEYEMFFSNIFSFETRRSLCELAYRATRRELIARADELEPVFAAHGIRLNTEVLADAERTPWEGARASSSRRLARR